MSPASRFFPAIGALIGKQMRLYPLKTISDMNPLNIADGRHIARFKRPRRYFFMDSLPKNNYGKVLKNALRDTLHPE